MCEKNFSPAFYIGLERFTELISMVFWADRNHRDPISFAREIMARPYLPWDGAASFYVIPTPYDEWGWMYETISGRQLIWIPEGILYTRYLEDSENFRGWLEDTLSTPLSLNEPEWLDTALKIAIAIPRIAYDPYEDSEAELLKALENVEELVNVLREIISHRPLDYLEKTVERPPEEEETGHMYDYYAEAAASAEAREKERVWAAYQALLRKEE